MATVTSGSPPSSAPAWAALADIAARVADVSLRDRFALDPSRSERFTGAVGDLWVDWSRHPIDDETLGLLVDLADQRDVPGFCSRMLAGEVVNATEGRPAGHTALRAPDADDGVTGTLGRMADLADRIRGGSFTGATGEPVRAVVSLGIGGSHLGPAMAHEALTHLAHPDVTVRFSSSLDAADLTAALAGLEPATTLVVVCSKSFTTTETMVAADTATAWLSEGVGNDISRHLAAATAAPQRASARGIDPDLVFAIPESVGGRFSLSSAMGLALMVAIGPEAFHELLAGMHAVDRHLGEEPVDGNVPMLLGLIDVWQRSFLGATSLAVVPYSHALRRLPDHLQQLMMESLGKRVTADGSPTAGPTGPVVFGAGGTDSQHAFFQLLHQGTDVVPVDLIGVARPVTDPRGAHHDGLMANLLAQAESLAFGRTDTEAAALGVAPDLVAHQEFPGNRPSTVVLLPELSPSTLGQLVALYEHRTVVQAAVWGINPFDQWGVELGKQLTTRFHNRLTDGVDTGREEPSSGLIRRYRGLRGRD